MTKDPSKSPGPPAKTPEDLQRRIQKLKAPPEAGGAKLARGLSLVMSLGATVALSIYGGYLLGHWLDGMWKSMVWTPVCLLAGVGIGALAAWKMLKPFLDDP